MRHKFGKLIGTVMVSAGALAAGALAAPTCVNINDLGPDGSGIVLRKDVTSGYCVLAKDKLYGDFDLGNLPKDTVLIFNNNPVNGLTRYQLSFDATYKTNKTYKWNYDVSVAPGSPTGTVIVSLDSDFTQTAGGPSILDKATNPTTADPIHLVKIGADLQAAISNTSTSFGTGITDLMISETLVDKGTISSVTNTVVQFSPPNNNVPEPATLAILGAGLLGASFGRRKRRS